MAVLITLAGLYVIGWAANRIIGSRILRSLEPAFNRIAFVVTRTLVDEETGQMLAAVYVPTTHNPNSGYPEIVPRERVVSTDLTINEAMKFVISGGANAPDRFRFASPMASEAQEFRQRQQPRVDAGTAGDEGDSNPGPTGSTNS